jgi:hypothetical protein
MNQEKPLVQVVDQFILEQIDTVPHLEALLLAWNKREKAWPVEEMSRLLFIPEEMASKILRDLMQRGLLEAVPGEGGYVYKSASPEQDSVLAAVDATYRRELIRVTRMIHSKGPASLRDFARAFRFTKEKD